MGPSQIRDGLPSRNRDGIGDSGSPSRTVQPSNRPLEVVPKFNHIVPNCTRFERSDCGKEAGRDSSNVQASCVQRMHGGLLVCCSACMQRSMFMSSMYSDGVLLDLGSAHTFPYTVTALLLVHFLSKVRRLSTGVEVRSHSLGGPLVHIRIG